MAKYVSKCFVPRDFLLQKIHSLAENSWFSVPIFSASVKLIFAKIN